MRTSRSSLSKNGHPKWLTILWLVVSFVGFLNATYLTIHHYQGTTLVCSDIGDCDRVLTSQYAVVSGIPVALAGALHYLALVLLSVAYLDTRSRLVNKALAVLITVGFGASLILASLQVFVIHALCIYCLLSAILSALLFSSLLISRRHQ